MNVVDLARFSRAIYESEESFHWQCSQWGFDEVRWIERRGTQAAVIHRPGAPFDLYAVVFRGTQPDELQDWLADLRVKKACVPFGRVHRGFLWALLAAWPEIESAIPVTADTRIHFTGHSLGGALATLAAALFVHEYDQILVASLTTFGCPRVGNGTFARWLGRLIGDWTARYVHCADLVPRVPRIGYRHVGRCFYFDRHGNLYRRPGWLYRFCDRVLRHAQHVGRLGTPAIADHSMDRYLDLIESHYREA